MEEIDTIPAFNELEWHRQMSSALIPFTASSSLAQPQIDMRGKRLWLTVRRALCMVISAFDEHYGIGKR